MKLGLGLRLGFDIHTAGGTLSAPTLTFLSIAGGSASLNWTSATADSFEIYRGTSTGVYTLLDTVLGSETSYNDATVVDGTTYYYAIKRVYGVLTSGYSNEMSAYALYAAAFIANTGNDLTGQYGRADLPYATIDAVLAVLLNTGSPYEIRFLNGAGWEIPNSDTLNTLAAVGITLRGHTTNIEINTLNLGTPNNHLVTLNNVTVNTLSKPPGGGNFGEITLTNSAAIGVLSLSGGNGADGAAGSAGGTHAGANGADGVDGDPPTAGGAGVDGSAPGGTGEAGRDGDFAWSGTLRGTGSVNTISGDGGNGGQGGSGGTGGAATGGNGGNGGSATGTDQDGAPGGDGGAAYVGGGDGGNGGNGGNGSMIYVEAGISIGGYSLNGGTGGAGGLGGTGGAATVGGAGAGGAGNGAGVSGISGTSGSPDNASGWDGPTGYDGYAGSIIVL